MVVCYFFKFVCIDCKAGICDLFGAAFAAKDPLARISEVKIAYPQIRMVYLKLNKNRILGRKYILPESRPN